MPGCKEGLETKEKEEYNGSEGEAEARARKDIIHYFFHFSLFAQLSNIFAFTVVYWFDFQHLHLAQVGIGES